MKRHVNRLLQRQRAEIESTPSVRRRPPPAGSTGSLLEPQDGYDWLRQISQIRCIPAR